MTIQAKQIERQFYGFVEISNFTANGTSDVITTPLTTALTTAGDSGVAVPLQVASSSQIGVVTGASTYVYNRASQEPVLDASGNKVYARVTEASGVYTLSYYSLVSGTETAYSFASDTVIDFGIVYSFDFYRVPKNFAVAYPVGDINIYKPSGGGTGQRVFSEPLTVTALNTVSNLTYTPVASNLVVLYINGVQENSYGSAFTVSGKSVTINPTNLKYNVATTDVVVAVYPTNE
ncbi:hypothetical protein BLD44_028520 [Mastigocladus laminosus UU774]|nr:hypothetical protein BLD44_028520 [Mastigocladus laminosus UU774]